MAFNLLINGVASSLIKPKLFSLDSKEVKISDRVSFLGTPVISNLEIPAGKYNNDDGEVVPFDGVRLDSVLFEISMEKRIIKTPINGRQGDVKQFISLGDYSINAHGVIVGQSDASTTGFQVSRTSEVPEEEIRKLNEICRVPMEVEVVSQFLDFFDVSTVVIENCSFSQAEGFEDSVYFHLSMLSDNPIELK